MEYQITASINFSSSGNPLEQGSREYRWQLVGCKHPFPPRSSAHDLSRSRESQLDLRFLIREYLSPYSSLGVFSLMCFKLPIVHSVRHAVATFEPSRRFKLLSRDAFHNLSHHLPNILSKLLTPSLIPHTISSPPHLLSLIPQSPVPVSRPSHRLPLSTGLVPRLSPLDIIQYLRSIKECIASGLLLAPHLDHFSMIKGRGELTIYPVQRGC
jgi:hypothetical protein